MTFVLFGATGDLAVKKIFPALEDLLAKGDVSGGSRIVAVSRRDWKDADFRTFLREKNPGLSATFVSQISYANVNVEEGRGFDGLAEVLKAGSAAKAKSGAETLFYMSLAPAHQGRAIKGLKDAGLLSAGEKLLIEKPFGTDLKTARALDKTLLAFLDESQIHRVDHYLGKDTVRAIMDLRERTPEFLDVVSADTVSSICARMFEEKGIDGRGAFYDGVGAFRDVGQNHLLEMLAAVIAELPKKAAAKSTLVTGAGSVARVDWRAVRATALANLAAPSGDCDLMRRGRYEGYEAETGVPTNSDAETAFEIETTLSAGPLKGVQIILEAGKKMGVSESLVEIAFKPVEGLPRTMTFRVQPEQEIHIEYRNGSSDTFDIPKTRDAYGNVILGALSGDQRGFAGSAEVEALWKYADAVVACLPKLPLERYDAAKPFISLIR